MGLGLLWGILEGFSEHILSNVDLIFSIEFFVNSKEALLHYMKGLSILCGDSPCFVSNEFDLKNKPKVEMVSTL